MEVAVARRRGRKGRGIRVGFTLKVLGILLMVIYAAYFLLVFYTAFSSPGDYTAIVQVNPLGEGFIAALVVVPVTIALIMAGLFFSFREKARFNANISYEVRTALNNIVGYAEMLQDGHHGKLNQQQRERLEVVRRNADSILKTVDDMDSLWK